MSPAASSIAEPGSGTLDAKGSGAAVMDHATPSKLRLWPSIVAGGITASTLPLFLVPLSSVNQGRTPATP